MLNGMLGKCTSWCHNKSVGLLVLRLALGSFFVAHGIAKFQNIDATVAMFGTWGISPLLTKITAAAEVLAGAAFVLGAFQWIAAAIITTVMVVAIVKVTGAPVQGQPELLHFIFGWGPNMVYAATAVALAFCGAGRWSLTAWYMKRKGIACHMCKVDHGGAGCANCGSQS
jgi:putative oxidoreductase